MSSSHKSIMKSAAMALIWDFPKLKGQENYHPWSKNMKSALRYSRLWDIVDHGVNMLPDDMPEEESHMEAAANGQPERKVIDKPGPTETQVKQYETSLEHWKDLNSQAMELIYAMCENEPREYVEDEEWATNRWVKLESHYQDLRFKVRFTKYKQFIHTTMANSDNDIETYCTNLRSRARELKKMNAAIDQWLMVAVLLHNVEKNYPHFVHRIVASGDEVPDFDKVVTMLYKEDRLLKSDTSNIAMAAAMKRYKKELGDKKTSGKGNSNTNSCRGVNNSRGGRGGNSSSNNNGGGVRHSKNPKNVNYKGDGDPPECSKCTPSANGKLKKHWPHDCWTLHEDRMPKKYRNNKPKANKASGPKGDFMDSNGTHFSAMAMPASLEQVIEGDDEYWGWSVIDTAPKECGEVITEENNIQSLEQSLTRTAQLIENREITENESATQVDLLVPGTDFGCEANRGAPDALPSQQDL